MKIAEHKIIGAMVAPRGKAPFDRANIVVAPVAEGEVVWQVRAYLGDDEVEGKPATLEEWTALLKSEQAIVVEPTDLVSGAALWVLRSGFDGRDGAIEELRSCGALLRDVFRMDEGSFGVLVNERVPKAFELRDRWAQKAFEEALTWAKSNHWERARASATRAFVVERSMSPDRVALLALAHERCGNGTRAAGYLEMARRSRGADFSAQVSEKRRDLERSIQDVSPPSEPRPRNAAAIHIANDNALRGGLRRLHQNARAAR